MTRSTLRLLLIALTMTTGISAQTFTDNTFNDADWSEVVLVPSSSATATCTSGQDLTSGNPAPSRKTEHVYQPGWINCAHVSLTSTYDPGIQGSIVTLQYSFDAVHYTEKLGGVRYTPLVLQNNTYYIVAPGQDVRSASWTPFSGSNLTEGSFTRLDGPSKREHPDFSCRGAKIQFGFVTRNHLPSGPDITTRSAIDNWSIELKTEPCERVSGCPPKSIPTVVNGVTFCCVTDNDAPVGSDTSQFCCERPCPPGSVETTLNGEKYCCQTDPRGVVCCTPKGRLDSQ